MDGMSSDSVMLNRLYHKLFGLLTLLAVGGRITLCWAGPGGSSTGLWGLESLQPDGAGISPRSGWPPQLGSVARPLPTLRAVANRSLSTPWSCSGVRWAEILPT